MYYFGKLFFYLYSYFDVALVKRSLIVLIFPFKLLTSGIVHFILWKLTLVVTMYGSR